MIIRTEIETKAAVISAVYCNMCGKEIKATTIISGQFEFAVLSANWGYGSAHDSDIFTLEFCEDCIYRRLLPVCKIQPESTETF
jgi:hypothetical protein